MDLRLLQLHSLTRYARTDIVLAGSFPSRQLKMVQAWIEIHKDELYADWDLAVSGEEPFRIEPLR